MELLLEKIKNHEVRKLVNKVRRFIRCHFNAEYLGFYLKKRRGGCLQCGECCSLVYKCPFLIRKGIQKKCLIYHTGRPRQCRLFPIDRFDLSDVNFKCGYFFDYNPASDWKIKHT
ncbi:MAG TPA: hypothetical protein VII00_05165 [bacterium]